MLLQTQRPLPCSTGLSASKQNSCWSTVDCCIQEGSVRQGTVSAYAQAISKDSPGRKTVVPAWRCTWNLTLSVESQLLQRVLAAVSCRGAPVEKKERVYQLCTSR